MNAELTTIIDFIRYGATRFAEAELTFAHSNDSELDEATHLVLASLHMPPDLPPAYGTANLTANERTTLMALIDRRVHERVPVAYLVGETWFAGMKFKSDARALVPRSPMAELIESGFLPWLDDRKVEHVLDLCTGSGCIGIAMAEYQPQWQVDLADLSEDALALARENIALHDLDEQVHVLHSDLFDDLGGRRYDLIVSNPPYVTEAEYAALPGEYAHEPRLGLVSGDNGLDLCLRILVHAADYLNEGGVLIVEVGASERELNRLLPEVPFAWIEFKTGQMGVFALEYHDLVEHADAFIRASVSRNE